MTKGTETRDRILDRAFRLATRDGLEGVTLGTLASELGLSKSGLFAHFRSKEDLQIEILRTASARFEDAVLRPAFRAPRGLPRIKKLFDGWLQWLSDPALPGGCLFVAAATELDDKEGRPREHLVATLRQLHDALAKAAHLAVGEGQFRKDLDCEQFAFELYGIVLSYNQSKRLMRDARPEARARAAFQRLLAFAAAKA
jgi:AcrR family transcriptional regulator